MGSSSGRPTARRLANGLPHTLPPGRLTRISRSEEDAQPQPSGTPDESGHQPADFVNLDADRADARVDRMSRPSGLRALATTIAIVVALIATLATSRAPVSIGNTVEGHPLLLTPERPLATAGFLFEANAAAFDEPIRVLLTFDFEPFWSDVPAGRAPALTPNLVKIIGPPLGERGFIELQPEHLVCFGADCLGTYQARFRLPPDLDIGSVRVEWSVTADISYYGSDPPDGARAQVRVERPVYFDAPVRIFEGEITLDGEQPIVRDILRVRSEAPIPEKGALAVELGEFYVNLFGPDVVFVTLVQDDKSPQRLRPSTSTPLDIPKRCRNGPCSFSLSLVTELRTPENDTAGGFRWGLTSQGVPAPVEVTPEEQALPVLTDRVSLGIVHLEAQSESDRYHVAIRVSEAALPLAEFGHSEPVIQAVLSFNPTQKTLEFPDEGQLEMRFWFPSTPTDLRHHPPFEAHRSRPNLNGDPVSFIVPNKCGSDVACKFELILRFATTGPNSSFEGPIELEPTLDVLIAYPITDRVPEGAVLEVALERRA